MCLVAVAFRASERYPFMLAANRDERHARPAAAAGWWDDRPDVLGGRDLEAGGTWLAMTRAGRVAAVTNIFEPGNALASRSRGLIVTDFLSGVETPQEFAQRIETDLDSYGPFYALLFAAGALGLTSNRVAATMLDTGVHVFSNNAPGSTWPKLGIARAAVAAQLDAADPEPGLFALLTERASVTPASEVSGPSGAMHSVFVSGAEFGTRCSTVILVDHNGQVTFVERRFDAQGQASGMTRVPFALGSGEHEG